MAKVAGIDQFANVAYLDCTESAANTLTFAQLALANTLMSEKMALVIHRAEWYFGAYSSLNSTGDKITLALTLSDRITDLADLGQPEILFHSACERLDIGAAASGLLVFKPEIRDFNDLPGGGILVPADRLYLGVQGSGAAAAFQVKMRLWYTVKPLATADYWELIEARRVMTT